MRSHKTETHKKIVTKTTSTTITCDICEASITKHGKHTGINGTNWAMYDFDFSTTILKIEIGNAYPEETFGERYEIDICPDCFEEKLIPWLRSLGVEREWEEFG
jgi:uncharacterized protein (DUF2225 family)